MIKFFKTKSAVKIQNNSISVSSQSNAFNLQNYLKKNQWEYNPYSYYSGTLATSINKLSNIFSSMDFVFKNDLNEISDNKINDLIKIKLKSPCFRQPTIQQFLFDIFKEYTFNRNIYILVQKNQNLVDKMTVLNANEVQIENNTKQNIDGVLTQYTIIFNKTTANTKRKVFTFNEEKECYENLESGLLLYVSELVLEQNDNINCSQLIYRKNILNEIYASVETERYIDTRNLFILDNKHDANLLIVNNKEYSAISSEEQEQQLTNKIKQYTENAMNNGKTQTIFSNNPLEANLLKLNDGNFKMQFEELKQNAKKEILSYLSIPVEMYLEQAKFTNNITASIRFIEEAIKPRAHYVCRFLTKIFANEFNCIDNFEVDYDSTMIMQEYRIENAIKKAPYSTLAETRADIGRDAIKGTDYFPQSQQQTKQEEPSFLEAMSEMKKN